jgi:protein pelota
LVTATGAKDTERIKLRLCVEVEAVDFDPEAGELRIRGKNTTENEHIRNGVSLVSLLKKIK